MAAGEELAVLEEVTRHLEHAGIPYMVTGSIAANFYAVPRMTRDIDIVVELSERDIERLVKTFEKDFYLEPEAVQAAVRNKGMFNLIQPDSSEKGSSPLLALDTRGNIDYTKLMARPLRIEYPGAYYHVMNRGFSRRDIVLQDEDRQTFLDLLGDISRLWKIEIYAYCIMDNHYHLLLQTRKGRLSRAMRHLDGIYTQRFNRSHHRDGPLFRGRYKAVLIDAEEYFLSVVRYLHQNPVMAGVVSDVDRYRWSSHWGYLYRRERPVWLNTHAVLSRFGGLKEYQEFMHSEVEKEVVDFYRGPYRRPILGDRGFIEWIKERLGNKARVEEEKPESRRVFGLEIEQIVEVTARVYGKRLEELRRKRRGEENEARSMALYLCRTLGGHKHSEIGRVLGIEKASTVSSACLRMRRKVEVDRKLAGRARRIEERLQKSQERT